jgi:hypothetical protein
MAVVAGPSPRKFDIVPPVQTIGKGYRPAKTRLAGFRYWHVEPLLNQTADLLDRCTKDTAEYNALRAQWETLLLQTTKAKRDQEIVQDRVQAGWLDQNSIALRNEGESLYANSKTLDQSRGIIEDLRINPQGIPGIASIELQLGDNSLAASPTHFGKLTNEAKIAWEEKEKAFRGREIESDQLDLAARLAAMADKAGALNFSDQADRVGDRIARDLEDAIDRLTVASDGLSKLYGYAVKPPALRDYPLDEAIRWTRDAIKWLVAFGQLDQSFTRVFSIKTLVGERLWTSSKKDAIASGKLALAFRIPRGPFDQHTFVRLRGLSAVAVGPAPTSGPWLAEVAMPQKAVSAQNSQGEVSDNVLDQTTLPSCHLGRVGTYEISRQPEMGGMIALMNASPIGVDGPPGQCALNLRPPFENKDDFSRLNDLHVELSVVGRPL